MIERDIHCIFFTRSRTRDVMDDGFLHVHGLSRDQALHYNNLGISSSGKKGREMKCLTI
jgi:hypothetical protein